LRCHGLNPMEQAVPQSKATSALITSIVLAAVVFGVSASADERAKAGARLLQKLCVTCHLMDGDPPASVPTGPPSFGAMANRFDQTAERIAWFLMSPHPPMPAVQLTRSEILEVIDYLQSLRGSALPPLKREQPPVPSPQKKLAPASAPRLSPRQPHIHASKSL
jgi:cytochrome c